MSLLGDIASIWGASKASDAAKANLNFARQQFEYQKGLAEQQQKLANQAARLGMATQVDATGNVTYYDEQTNTWKSVLSAEGKAQLDTSNREQLLRNGQDSVMARGERLTNARRRSQEDATAQTDLAQYNRDQARGGRYDAGNIASSLRLARQGYVNDAFDDVASNVATQTLRSGATGAAAGQGRLAAARAKAMAEVMGNPDLEGMQEAERMNSGRMSDTVNRYNQFASRASNISDAAFNPSNVGSNSGQTLSAARALAGNSQLGAAGAIGNSGVGVANAAGRVDFTMGGQAGGIEAGWGEMINSWEDKLGKAIAGGMPTGGGSATSSGHTMNRSGY